MFMSDAFAAGLIALSAVVISFMPFTGDVSEPTTEMIFIEPAEKPLGCVPDDAPDYLVRNLNEDFYDRKYLLDEGETCTPIK